ncbi:MAG: group II truncated hemoglobin [Cypionkella sp.]
MDPQNAPLPENMAMPQNTPMIEKIGGEAGVLQLVNQFYDLIESLPEGAAIMAMHQRGHGLDHVRPAQFEFLCGFFGGRRYYMERNGHMNLREIHAHVEITAEDAENWLCVMAKAMDVTCVAEPMRGQIMTTFRRAALMLVNVG